MSYPHQIRLRGPWVLEPLAPPGSAITVQMPCRWQDTALGDFRGTVRHTRSFGMPRRLDPWERIWVTCAGATGKTVAALNGERLGEVRQPEAPFRFELTDKLRERNVLSFDVSTDRSGGGLFGEVALEIRAAAWMEDVCIDVNAGVADVRLRISGRVHGVAPQPLDAYVLVGRHCVFQSSVEPAEAGVAVSWEIPLEAAELGTHMTAAVELVCGSAIWYREEQQLELPPAAPRAV